MLGALVAAALAAGPAPAQELAARVAALGDGPASFLYPVREDVEVCDHSVRTDGGSRWWGRRDAGRPERCSVGEARVELRVSDGRVTDVELRPAGVPVAGSDLGRATGPEAVAFLLGLARAGATSDAAEDALAPAALAGGGAEAWPGLLELARDRGLAEDVREAALFWVGQSAADAVTADLTEIAGDDDEAQGVRDAAVFALSRRPADQAVPALMEVARTATEPETRRSAMFWLARVDDPRVVPFFEEILRGRSPG